MNETTVLRNFTHRQEAEMARQMLRDRGIQSFLDPEAPAGTSAAPGPVRLMVRPRDYAKAREAVRVLGERE